MPFLVGLAVGGVATLYLSREAAEAAGNLASVLKWSAVLGGGYLLARHLKVL